MKWYADSGRPEHAASGSGTGAVSAKVRFFPCFPLSFLSAFDIRCVLRFAMAALCSAKPPGRALATFRAGPGLSSISDVMKEALN